MILAIDHIAPWKAFYGNPYGYGPFAYGPAAAYRAGAYAPPVGRFGPYAADPMFPGGPVDAVVVAEQFNAFWNKHSPELGVFVDPVSFTLVDEINLKGKAENCSLTGYDAIKANRDQYHAAFPDLQFHLENVTQPDADGVFYVKFRATGTHTGALGDVPATGKKVESTGMNEFRIVGGRVVQCTVYSGKFLPFELGLIPAN